ncbi:MAG: NHL repeat-containing protein [Thermomicrobiales bacterium]
MLSRWQNNDGFRSKSIFIAVATLIVILTQTLRVIAAPPATDPFERTWQRSDQPVFGGQVSRTWMWGPEAFTTAMNESYADSPGGMRTVQYFDKSRMEISNPAGDPASSWYVTNGLLVVELITGEMQTGDAQFELRTPARVNVAGDADDAAGPTYLTLGQVLDEAARDEGAPIIERLDRSGAVSSDPGLSERGVSAAHYVAETDHTVASPFWTFMNSDDLVYVDGQYQQAPLFPNPFYATGYPVTEAYWSEVKVGGAYKDVLTQAFERRVLTYTPDNPAGWQVEAGNVGQHYFSWRYEGDGGELPEPTPEPTPQPDPSPTPDPEPSPTPDPEPTPEPTPEPLPSPVVDYAYVNTIRNEGDPLNRFQKLSGLDLTPDGNLILSDQNTDRIQKYSTKGVLQFAFSVDAYNQGDVAVDADGNIWVVDQTNSRLIKYDSSGDRLETTGWTIKPPMKRPSKLAIGPDGKFYITDLGNSRIVVFITRRLRRRYLGRQRPRADFIPPVSPSTPTATSSSRICQRTGSRSPLAAGEHITSWGSEGTQPGQFLNPTDLTVDADGPGLGVGLRQWSRPDLRQWRSVSAHCWHAG